MKKSLFNIFMRLIILIMVFSVFSLAFPKQSAPIIDCVEGTIYQLTGESCNINYNSVTGKYAESIQEKLQSIMD